LDIKHAQVPFRKLVPDRTELRLGIGLGLGPRLGLGLGLELAMCLGNVDASVLRSLKRNF